MATALPSQVRRALSAAYPATARRAVAAVYPSKARPALPWESHRAPSDYGLTAEPDWRAIDWGPLVRTIKIAGREVNYVDVAAPDGAGERPPILFVHGLGANWQCWLENIPCAALERRVVALDLPGFGRSEMPADKISISGYGRWVDELCERLELGPVAIVGNSMGGFIGAEIAVSYPQRAQALVLVAAAGISITNLRRRPALTIGRLGTAVGAFQASRVSQVVSRPRLRHLALAPIMRHPSRLRPDVLLEVMQATPSPGFTSALDALMSYDFRDRLGEIGCPTLVVWGEDDILVPVADADEFERLIPESKKVILEETGHVPMLERPQTFNRCLMDFLAGSEPGAQPVSAPSDAEPTERAYLASTPAAKGGGGGS